MKAHELMTDEVAVLAADASVADAIELVTELEVRHVPIVADGGQLLGVVSDKDLQRIEGLLALEVGDEHSPRRIENILGSPITSLLSGQAITCSPSASADEVIDLLVGERIGAVVVTDEAGEVVGIISNLDVLCAARGRL